MTIPQQPPLIAEPYAAPATPGASAQQYTGPFRSGRNLASAVAVFLGGYLLLAGFTGLLGNTAMVMFATLSGRPGPELPAPLIALAVLQFLFAIGVVVVGLLLGDGPAGGKLVGVVVVAAGSLLTFVFVGLRFNGLLPIPGGQAGIPFNAVFANTWFAIVLFVGVGWLLARRARLGWLAILGTLILIPLPIAFTFADFESGAVQIIMYLLSAIIGVGIILAGRPFRDASDQPLVAGRYVPGRSLAAAIAVFLGGYLLLLIFNGRLIQSLANVLPVRARPMVPPSIVALDILQLLVAIAIVVLGLALARGSFVGKVIGSLLVAVGLIVHAIFLTLRAFGDVVNVPRPIIVPFNAVFVNSWFLIVLLVGIAWLLTRRARLGWLALLGTLILIPVPMAFQLNGVEYGFVQLVMLLLSAVVGAGIIIAGRPTRDE